MKKSIFSVCIMALFTLTLFAFTPEPPALATEEAPSWGFDVKPGLYSEGNNPGCVGPWFCIITHDENEDETTNVQNNLDGTVTFSYNFNEFNEANQQYYTTHSNHEIPEDSDIFDSAALAALELPQGTLIKAGFYPVTLTGGRMIVTYDLVQ